MSCNTNEVKQVKHATVMARNAFTRLLKDLREGAEWASRGGVPCGIYSTGRHLEN